jgi:3-oxoacyl-[acyl-carrier-protein] synthase II
MPRTRVVVTGLGATTPLGGDALSTWDGLLVGRSGVRALANDWAADLPVKIAAQVTVDPGEVLERVEARRLDRSAQLAVIAAMEAWRHAGFGLNEDNPVDRDRLGVAIATGIGGLHTLLDNWDIQKEKGARRVSPLGVPMLMANASAANVSIRLGARAGAHTPVSACASSNESISLGLDMIRLGRADVVVVGGTESCIHPMPIASFAQMQAMSRRNDDPERASRPWDVDRDGFVLGEGAACIVLERADAAKARGARVHARLAGAGATADGYDLVAPHPEGEGAGRAISAALRDAGLTKADIGHVNAHATSTPVGDTAEAGAIRSSLGDHVLVSATKSQTGHLLGAAGALESVFTILALREQVVPATANLENPDDDAAVQALDIVRHEPRRTTLTAAVNDSFGFGGHNIALVFTTA